jgi:hypothetical protein
MGGYVDIPYIWECSVVGVMDVVEICWTGVDQFLPGDIL